MKLEVLLRPQAESDLTVAFRWYEERNPGLGFEFRQAVEDSIRTIRLYPHSHRVVYNNVRRALVHRFPYAVFYTVSEQAIVVLACLHVRRDPAIWPSSARV